MQGILYAVQRKESNLQLWRTHALLYQLIYTGEMRKAVLEKNSHSSASQLIQNAVSASLKTTSNTLSSWAARSSGDRRRKVNCSIKRFTRSPHRGRNRLFIM